MTNPRLDPAKLDAVKTIIVHDNCADGTASAILLQDAFYGQDVKIRFVQYGTADFQALTPEPGMLFCDFSPSIPIHQVGDPMIDAKLKLSRELDPKKLQEWVDAGVIILDHHKTAKAVVEAMGDNGVFGDEQADVGSCGAVLAYRHVWLPRRGDMAIQRAFAEKFATLAGIRDTWQRQDPRWRDACVQANALHFFPNEKWLSRTLTDIAATWDRDSKSIGEVLWIKNEKKIERTVKNAYRFTTAKGTRVVTFNGLKETSDSAETIGAEADLIVGVIPTNEEGTPKYLCSTRSHTNFDCSAFAKSFGGGGHTRAAGFNVPLDVNSTPNPFTFVRNLVEQYEGQS